MAMKMETTIVAMCGISKVEVGMKFGGGMGAGRERGSVGQVRTKRLSFLFRGEGK